MVWREPQFEKVDLMEQSLAVAVELVAEQVEMEAAVEGIGSSNYHRH